MEVHKNTTALNRFSIVLALLALNFLAIFFLPEKPMSKLIRISNIEFFFSLGQTLPLFIAIISLFGSYWILTAHSFASIKNRAIRQLIPNIVLPSITVLILGLCYGNKQRSILVGDNGCRTCFLFCDNLL